MYQNFCRFDTHGGPYVYISRKIQGMPGYHNIIHQKTHFLCRIQLKTKKYGLFPK